MLSKIQAYHVRCGVLTEWIHARRVDGCEAPTSADVLNCPQLRALLDGSRPWRGGHPYAQLEQMQDVSLDEKAVQFVVEKTAEWVEIRAANTFQSICAADPSHSDLLRRLLTGKEALPSPPPKFYSQPRYDVAEGEPVQVSVEHRKAASGKTILVIADCYDFEWENEDAGILRFVPTGHRYRLDGKTLQRIMT